MYECEKAREVGFIGHTLRSVGGSQAPTQEWSVKRESAEKAYASYASAHREGGVLFVTVQSAETLINGE